MSYAALSRSYQPIGRTSFTVPWRGCFFKTDRTAASSRRVINERDFSTNVRMLRTSLKPFVTDNLHRMIVIALSISGITFRDFRNQPASITDWSHVQQCIAQSKHDAGTSFET